MSLCRSLVIILDDDIGIGDYRKKINDEKRTSGSHRYKNNTEASKLCSKLSHRKHQEATDSVQSRGSRFSWNKSPNLEHRAASPALSTSSQETVIYRRERSESPPYIPITANTEPNLLRSVRISSESYDEEMRPSQGSSTSRGPVSDSNGDSQISNFRVARTTTIDRNLFDSFSQMEASSWSAEIPRNDEHVPTSSNSHIEITPVSDTALSSECRSDTSAETTMWDYVIKTFRRVNSEDDDIMEEERNCEKSKASIMDVFLIPRSEEENLCHNVLIPGLQRLSENRKSLAKIEILRVLHNVEFRASFPSYVNTGVMPWNSECIKHTTRNDDRSFCSMLVLPTLRRLDEERKSFAVLEIQKVLHSLRFGYSV